MKVLTTLFLLAALVGCTAPTENSPEIKSESALKATENLCFRKEYPYKDNPAMKDVMELQIHIAGEKVTGTYNWLPAEKDQRKGNLTGTIVDKTISATYNSRQEGIESIVPLQIALTEKEAVVTGENPEQGLDATLAKVSCE